MHRSVHKLEERKCYIIHKLQQDGAYNLRSSNKGLMLQAPNDITKKTLGDRALEQTVLKSVFV